MITLARRRGHPVKRDERMCDICTHRRAHWRGSIGQSYIAWVCPKCRWHLDKDQPQVKYR